MGATFAPASRKASSNYGVGTDGRIGLYVDEKNRAWTSSSSDNDNMAVTIEVANNSGAPDWTVSDKALEATINLCVDICQRNNIPKLNYTGNANGNLTEHNHFAPTLCPGPYLKSKLPYIAETVNKRLNSVGSTPTSNTSTTASKNISNTSNAIMGKSAVTAENMAAFLLSKNSAPKLNCTPLQLAQIYIVEGNKEGVRGDIAFCQAIQETGWFKFGNDVLAEQNNYCGYGATNSTPRGKGAWFRTPQEGVRAQIQHLKAYSSRELLVTELVQPFDSAGNKQESRFIFVKRGISPNWEDLNGKWAVPGTDYGQKILKLYSDLTAFKPIASTSKPTQTTQNAQNAQNAIFTPYTVRVTADLLNIRAGAGTTHKISGTITDKGVYTIVEESSGTGAAKWGRLKSGIGWIALDLTQKV